MLACSDEEGMGGDCVHLEIVVSSQQVVNDDHKKMTT